MKLRRPLPAAATACRQLKIVAIGCSAGGFDAMQEILPELSPTFPLPIVVVIHLSPDKDSLLPESFGRRYALKVKEAEDKEPLEGGVIYFAPPGYHLLTEKDGTLSLTVEEPVYFSRPSIDVLFDSVAMAYGPEALGIVLSGANADGAAGLTHILDEGGLGLVENPRTARYDAMPKAAEKQARPQAIMTSKEIAAWLSKF